MKTLSILFAIVPLLNSAFGQTVTEVDAPKMVELGIRKIEFRARPDAGQVAIFRLEETHSIHGLEVYDTITYGPGKQVIDHLLLQDLGRVYQELKGKWGITGSFGGGIRDGLEFVGDKVGKDAADFRFSAVEDGKAVDYKLRFSVLLVTYDEAKKLHPKLPAPNPEGWVFADMLKKQGKNPPNPHNKPAVPSETI